jgi:hypothetical protein
VEFVGEIGRGGVVEGFEAERQNLVLDAKGDREPVKGFEQGCDVVGFLLFEHEAGSVVLHALKSVSGGVGEARE